MYCCDAVTPCTELWGCCLVKKFDDMFGFFDASHEHDGQTERQNSYCTRYLCLSSHGTAGVVLQHLIRNFYVFVVVVVLKTYYLIDMMASLPCCEIYANIC